MSEEKKITAGELIEYMKKFDPDKEVVFVVIDTHQERKYAFQLKELGIVTDMEEPLLMLDIDRRDREDITREKDEAEKT